MTEFERTAKLIEKLEMQKQDKKHWIDTLQRIKDGGDTEKNLQRFIDKMIEKENF